MLVHWALKSAGSRLLDPQTPFGKPYDLALGLSKALNPPSQNIVHAPWASHMVSKANRYLGSRYSALHAPKSQSPPPIQTMAMFSYGPEPCLLRVWGNGGAQGLVMVCSEGLETQGPRAESWGA